MPMAHQLFRHQDFPLQHLLRKRTCVTPLPTKMALSCRVERPKSPRMDLVHADLVASTSAATELLNLYFDIATLSRATR